MDVPTLSSWDTHPESVRALANQHADRHGRVVNWYPSHLLVWKMDSMLKPVDAFSNRLTTRARARPARRALAGKAVDSASIIGFAA